MLAHQCSATDSQLRPTAPMCLKFGGGDYGGFMAGDASLTAVELSPRWTRMVWGLSLGTSAAIGTIVGGVLTTTIAGAALGAFTALPGGALAALTLWSLGAVSLRSFTPGAGSGRRRLQLFRVVFGVLAGFFIGLEVAVAFALLGGFVREATAWILGPAVVVCAVGIIYPPGPLPAVKSGPSVS